MGQVIYLEPYLIAKEEEIRHYSLQVFPWSQIEEVKTTYFEPLTRFWTKQRRIMLDEATVRLLFEAFALGFKGQRLKLDQDRLVKQYQPTLDRMVERIISDFDLFRGLSSWKREAIEALFVKLTMCWFLKGSEFA
ncbi:hypothetical protein SAMN05444392_107213 [Seinonella peptonophila]|uniref:Uncharacterized protein n=1 Tax=Seinonella peptonophila TaxID=112248 RepID=A0A1M4YXY2_9BACL|nr:hypothetical protein [Seinonella peptonophila]SHF10565.1 hypothetical protein SAMN05444392_107213 [Seinonella peptonophila]